jgi:hypothetical protein
MTLGASRVSLMSRFCSTFWIGLFCLTACGSQDPSDSGGNDTGTGPLLPWKVGNTWTYRITEAGVITTKTTTIGNEEAVGGNGPNKQLVAFKVVTTKQDGTDQTVSWQTSIGDKVIRYREQAFHASSGQLELEEYWVPYKLHIDGSAEHTQAKASWLEDYEETKLPVGAAPITSSERERWVVQAVGESVSVPAGTFKGAIVFTKSGGTQQKTYWYVRGIGKVKETGGQTEELQSYQVAP